MAELFDLPELVSYAQVPQMDTATITLVRELVTIAIREAVGPSAYDLMDAAALRSFKPIALDVARRAAWNASGLRSTSRQIDDYTETDTYASETLAGVVLTADELSRIDRVLGRGGAFTVRPLAEPFVTPGCTNWP